VHREFLVATFSEEDGLRAAVRRIRERGFRVYDVYAPYPVHGLDEAMGLRRSRLPWMTLAAGVFGLSVAMGLQFYAGVFDWNLNVGGKPDNSTLAFVPIGFELTVLFAGLATVAAFLLRAGLFPGARARLLSEGTTEDTFAVVLRRRDATFDAGEARRLLMETGARQVTIKSVEW
jgi:Alternative complex III, ActD subunit